MMDAKFRNEIKEASEFLRSIIDEDELNLLVNMTHRMGVLRAVWKTGSIDPAKCAAFLYKDKDGIVDLKEFLRISKKYLFELAKEGLINENGELTEEAILLAKHHESVLNGKEDASLLEQLNELRKR